MADYKELESLINNIEDMDEETFDKSIATTEFVNKSFESVLTLHNEIIDQLKSENNCLKESLLSIQNIDNRDQETIEVLTSQIKLLQDELEFTKRKYKLMWNQAVENYKK